MTSEQKTSLINLIIDSLSMPAWAGAQLRFDLPKHYVKIDKAPFVINARIVIAEAKEPYPIELSTNVRCENPSAQMLGAISELLSEIIGTPHG